MPAKKATATPIPATTRKRAPAPPPLKTTKPAVQPTAKASAKTVTVTAPTAPAGKLDQMVALLRRAQGATIADLTKATGWQKHSVRGALAGTIKSRGYTVTSDKPGDERIYRIAPPPEVATARSKLTAKRK